MMPDLLMPGAQALVDRLRAVAASSARASGDGDHGNNHHSNNNNHHHSNTFNHNHNHNNNHSDNDIDIEAFSSTVRREISAHIASVLAQCARSTLPPQQARHSSDPHTTTSPGGAFSPLAAPPATSPYDAGNPTSPTLLLGDGQNLGKGSGTVGAPLSPSAGQRQGLGQGPGLARALVRSLPSSPSRSMSLNLTPAASSSSASTAAASSPSRGPPPASFQERLSSNLQKFMRSPSPELFRQNRAQPTTGTFPYPPAHPGTLSPPRDGNNTNILTTDGGDGSAVDSCRSPTWSQSFLRSVSGARARSHSPSGHSSAHAQQQQQQQQSWLSISHHHQQQQQHQRCVNGPAPFNGFACCSSCSVVHVSRAMAVISQMPQSNLTAASHISQSNLTAPSQLLQSKIMHASQSAMSAIIAGCPAALIPSSSSSSFTAPQPLTFLQRVAATQVRLVSPTFNTPATVVFKRGKKTDYLSVYCYDMLSLNPLLNPNLNLTFSNPTVIYLTGIR